MWAVMALGLNVVVGYAGLLDLGYVAFWAIGGYTAGWLMASPFNWTWTSTCSPRCRAKAAGHAHQLLAGLHRRRRAVRDPRHLISARRRCGCAVTTWPWSPSASARSSPSSSATPTTSPASTWPTATRASHHRPGRHRPVRGCRDRTEAVDQLGRRQRLEDPGPGLAGRHLHLHLAADPRGPARPGLAGHPRGRAGRQHDGRPAGPHQAARVRGRRVLRRHRRRRERLRRSPPRCRRRASTSASPCWCC